MKKVSKYKLIPKHPTITVPKGSQILSVGKSFGDVVVYALIDPNETTMVQETLRVFLTDQNITEEHIFHYKFLGTVSLGETAVYHIFY